MTNKTSEFKIKRNRAVMFAEELFILCQKYKMVKLTADFHILTSENAVSGERKFRYKNGDPYHVGSASESVEMDVTETLYIMDIQTL